MKIDIWPVMRKRWKGVLKICSKFTGEKPYRSVISIKLLCNFIEVTLWHGCYPVDLLHIFTTFFHKSTSGGLILDIRYILRQERRVISIVFAIIILAIIPTNFILTSFSLRSKKKFRANLLFLVLSVANLTVGFVSMLTVF